MPHGLLRKPLPVRPFRRETIRSLLAFDAKRVRGLRFGTVSEEGKQIERLNSRKVLGVARGLTLEELSELSGSPRALVQRLDGVDLVLSVALHMHEHETRQGSATAAILILSLGDEF